MVVSQVELGRRPVPAQLRPRPLGIGPGGRGFVDRLHET